MKLEIQTNNVPRNVIYGYELTEERRKEFDYIAPEDFDTHEFFRYKGNVYDIAEFQSIPDSAQYEAFKGWHGMLSESYFSGLLIRFVNNFEQVIVGQYFS